MGNFLLLLIKIFLFCCFSLKPLIPKAFILTNFLFQKLLLISFLEAYIFKYYIFKTIIFSAHFYTNKKKIQFLVEGYSSNHEDGTINIYTKCKFIFFSFLIFFYPKIKTLKLIFSNNSFFFFFLLFFLKLLKSYKKFLLNILLKFYDVFQSLKSIN